MLFLGGARLIVYFSERSICAPGVARRHVAESVESEKEAECHGKGARIAESLYLVDQFSFL